MSIKLISNVIGSLFPIIFPKQEFKPKRLVGAVICMTTAIGAKHLLGAEEAVQALEFAEDFLNLTEE